MTGYDRSGKSANFMVQNDRKMRLPILIILLLAAAITGCSRQKAPSYDNLAEADSLIDDNPEKSLEILNGIDNADGFDNSGKAYYALLLSQARYRNFIDPPNDSLIMEAVKYYVTAGDSRNLARAYLYAGCINGALGNEEKNLEFTQKAAETAEGIDDYWLLAYIYYNWGRILCDKKPYDMAAKYFEKSKHYAELANNRRYVANNWYELGGIKLLLKEFEIAEAFTDSAISIGTATGLQDRLPVFYWQLSVTQEFRHDYSTALESINKALQYIKYDPNPSTTYLRKGDILIRLNQLDSAEYYINKCKDESSPYSIADYEKLMSDLKEKRGDYRSALEHCRNYAQMLDSIKALEDSNRITTMQRRYDYMRMERDRNELAIENQHKTMVILAIAFVVACCALVAIVYIARKRKYNAQQLLAREQLLTKANAEMGEMTARLLAEQRRRSELEERLLQMERGDEKNQRRERKGRQSPQA